MAAGEMKTGIVVFIPMNSVSVLPVVASRSILGRKKYRSKAFSFSAAAVVDISISESFIYRRGDSLFSLSAALL